MSVYTSIIGDFFEEATVRLYGGTRFTTENQCDYCPDVQLGRRQYAEVKGCGRSGRIILYKDRLFRELEWCDTNNLSLDYVVWSHGAYIPDCHTAEDILDALSSSVIEVIRVPIQALAEIATSRPVKAINKRNPRGYVNGWQIPKTLLKGYCGDPVPRKRLKVDRNIIRNFNIFTYQHQSPVI